jgi:hypothetical protein
MPALYTVKQSAELLGTSTATVRRIADEFSEHLPDYQPAKGQARKLSDADLRTIYAIQSRLIDNPALIRAEVLAELSASGTEPLVIPATLPTDIPATAQESRGEPKTDRAISEAIDSPQNAIQPFLQAQSDTQRQIAELSAQLAEIRQERPQAAQGEERKQLWTFAIAITLSISLLLGGVTVSAILRDSQAALLMSVAALVVLVGAIVLPSLRR